MATRTSRYVQISVGTTNCLCFTTKLNMPYLKQGRFRLIFASWKKPLWNLSKIYLSVSIWQQISTNSNVIEQDNKTFYKTFYFQYCWSETLTAFSLALKKCGWLLWFIRANYQPHSQGARLAVYIINFSRFSWTDLSKRCLNSLDITNHIVIKNWN